MEKKKKTMYSFRNFESKDQSEIELKLKKQNSTAPVAWINV